MEELLNDPEFMKFFFEFPEHFPISKDKIYYIYINKIRTNSLKYNFTYKDMFINNSNCLKNIQNNQIKFDEIKYIITISVFIEEPLIDIINNNFEFYSGMQTNNKPLITNNYSLQQLEEKYKYILSFTHYEGITFEEIKPNIFKKYLPFKCLLTEYFEPYFDFDFDIFNFSESKYDSKDGYSTIYLCWN